SGQVCGHFPGVDTCRCGSTGDFAEAPTCGGTCPGGQVCGERSGGNSCECVGSDQTCLISQAPTCGGTCSIASGMCVQTGANSCGCVCDPALPCPFVTKWGSTTGPVGVAVDGSGNVFVADELSNCIQKFTNTGTFLTMWGSAGTGDGQFDTPSGVAVDGSGNVFVADTANDRIQKF